MCDWTDCPIGHGLQLETAPPHPLPVLLKDVTTAPPPFLPARSVQLHPKPEPLQRVQSTSLTQPKQENKSSLSWPKDWSHKILRRTCSGLSRMSRTGTKLEMPAILQRVIFQMSYWSLATLRLSTFNYPSSLWNQKSNGQQYPADACARRILTVQISWTNRMLGSGGFKELWIHTFTNCIQRASTDTLNMRKQFQQRRKTSCGTLVF